VQLLTEGIAATGIATLTVTPSPQLLPQNVLHNDASVFNRKP
jgi:hypothetical protein